LMRCVPKLGQDKNSAMLYPIPGRVPPPNNRPMGCVFSPRCDYARDRCKQERPQLRKIDNGATWVRCHFAEEIDPAHWVPSEELAASVSTKVTTSGAAVEATKPLLVVQDLKKYYPVQGNSLLGLIGLGKKRFVKAVENASWASSANRAAARVRWSKPSSGWRIAPAAKPNLWALTSPATSRSATLT
jgi:peptide/nickel transport system ATP-binding protein